MFCCYLAVFCCKCLACKWLLNDRLVMNNRSSDLLCLFMIHSCFYIVLLLCLISTLGLHLNVVVLYNDNKDHSFIHEGQSVLFRGVSAGMSPGGGHAHLSLLWVFNVTWHRHHVTSVRSGVGAWSRWAGGPFWRIRSCGFRGVSGGGLKLGHPGSHTHTHTHTYTHT